MGIIRNSIEVIGIRPEEELPKEVNGQILEYSETDYIYVPENWPLINSVSKIEINVNLKESRIVKTATSKILIFEGSRKLNITYKPVSYYNEINTLKLELPFNSFIDIPNDTEKIKSTDIYILDAYFKVMNNRKIYCFIVYMINVVFEGTVISAPYVDKTVKISTLIPRNDGDMSIPRFY